MKNVTFAKALLLGASLVLASGSGFAADAAMSPEMTKFHNAYVAADAERKKAKSLGFEWRDTAKFLKKAKGMAATDMAGAMKLVAKAHEEGLDAQRQAKDQANPDFHF